MDSIMSQGYDLHLHLTETVYSSGSQPERNTDLLHDVSNIVYFDLKRNKTGQQL